MNKDIVLAERFPPELRNVASFGLGRASSRGLWRLGVGVLSAPPRNMGDGDRSTAGCGWVTPGVAGW